MKDKFRKKLVKAIDTVGSSDEMRSLDKAINSGTDDEGLRALAMQIALLTLHRDQDKTYYDAAWEAAKNIAPEDVDKRRDIILSYSDELNRLSVKTQLRRRQTWQLFRRIVVVGVTALIVITSALLIKGMIWGY
jgi:hypothetical protein